MKSLIQVMIKSFVKRLTMGFTRVTEINILAQAWALSERAVNKTQHTSYVSQCVRECLCKANLDFVFPNGVKGSEGKSVVEGRKTVAHFPLAMPSNKEHLKNQTANDRTSQVKY